MNIQGINHLLFSVSDLKRSIKFYQQVFDATLLVQGRRTAYFDFNGLWLALNEEKRHSTSGNSPVLYTYCIYN